MEENKTMLDLVNKQFKFSNDLMHYPCFRHLWNRDESENKEEAYAYAAFIFFFNNPKSPYYAYSEDQRKYEIVKVIWPEHMVPLLADIQDDVIFVECNNTYLDGLNLSPYRAVVDIAKQALETLAREMKDKAIPIDQKLDNIRKINRGIEELKKAEKLSEEDEINSRVKGQRRIKKREA